VLLSSDGPFRTFGCVAVAAWTLIAPGCGPQRAKAVDVELAKATLVQVLDHWQGGGTIDELRTRKPEIVVQEAAWTNGQRLESYTIVNDGRAEDANWFCEVELSLAPKDGGEAKKKKITYVVGTDPVLTVFHAIL
jgi:hypothetical protein